jgi:hypothetical protein
MNLNESRFKRLSPQAHVLLRQKFPIGKPTPDCILNVVLFLGAGPREGSGPAFKRQNQNVDFAVSRINLYFSDKMVYNSISILNSCKIKLKLSIN